MDLPERKRLDDRPEALRPGRLGVDRKKRAAEAAYEPVFEAVMTAERRPAENS